MACMAQERAWTLWQLAQPHRARRLYFNARYLRKVCRIPGADRRVDGRLSVRAQHQLCHLSPPKRSAVGAYREDQSHSIAAATSSGCTRSRQVVDGRTDGRTGRALQEVGRRQSVAVERAAKMYSKDRQAQPERLPRRRQCCAASIALCFSMATWNSAGHATLESDVDDGGGQWLFCVRRAELTDDVFIIRFVVVLSSRICTAVIHQRSGLCETI